MRLALVVLLNALLLSSWGCGADQPGIVDAAVRAGGDGDGAGEGDGAPLSRSTGQAASTRIDRTTTSMTIRLLCWATRTARDTTQAS